MKTEAEACECWCPYSSVEGSNRVYVDLGGLAAATRCIASACMVWRPERRRFFKQSGVMVQHGETYATADVEERDTGSGYCGLAGRP